MISPPTEMASHHLDSLEAYLNLLLMIVLNFYSMSFTIRPSDFAIVVGDDLVAPLTTIPSGPARLLVGPDSITLKSVEILLPVIGTGGKGVPT